MPRKRRRTERKPAARRLSLPSGRDAHGGSHPQHRGPIRHTSRLHRTALRLEDMPGEMRALAAPSLTAGWLVLKLRSYLIRPLALHERVHAFDESRPHNTLTFTGAFSIAEAHSWLVICVAELPDRCPHNEIATYNFCSTFNGGTQLQVTYKWGDRRFEPTLVWFCRRGSAVFRSDNLSTIVILRTTVYELSNIEKRCEKWQIAGQKINSVSYSQLSTAPIVSLFFCWPFNQLNLRLPQFLHSRISKDDQNSNSNRVLNAEPHDELHSRRRDQQSDDDQAAQCANFMR